MNIEKIIRRKRGLEYAINKNNDEEAKKLLEQLLEEYYNNLEVCHHHLYLDYGYYKYHNGEVCMVEKEEAEFRVIMFPYCEKTISLLRTNDPDWDTKINGKKINIVNPFELDLEKLPITILKPAIQSLLSSFFHLEQNYCGHVEFSNNGYYKIINDQVEKSDKENADFRVVKCNYCGKNYLLPKRDNLYWDAVIENHAITVLPKAKQKAKNQYITRQQMYKQ